MRWEAVHGAYGHGVLSVAVLCQVAGMTRQNYYRQRTLRQRALVDEALVVALIGRERARLPQLGGRKLQYLLAGDLAAAGVVLGRDRFFALLKRHDLLIPRRAQSGARTTNSWHGFGVYPNLAKGLELTGPHQLLVSDITYVRTLEGFMFVSLVMDAFSRAIVGYDSSDTLEMEGALRALGLALAQLPPGSLTVHHSDRGSQYCCGAYIQQLQSGGLRISMTEDNHCYENAQAERLNGILKQEFGLGQTFARKDQVGSAVREMVGLYNHHRPHTALGFQFPMQVHTAAA
ncbi:MAG: IS3 family transposase [Phycisphaerae bacterium]